MSSEPRFTSEIRSRVGVCKSRFGHHGAAVIFSLLFANLSLGQTNLLSRERSPEQIQSQLIPAGEWRPFPTASDRSAWHLLPAEIREEGIRRGEEALKFDWPTLKATDFLDVARTGNRARYQNLRSARRARLAALVLAECIEGRGRFVDQIVNGLWVTCEETWWGVPAHIGALGTSSVSQQITPGSESSAVMSSTATPRGERGLPNVDDPLIDLFGAETASQLAWAIYLLGPQLNEVSALVVPRVEREIKRQILDPALARDDFWWMGFPNREVNNWNPWINSNWLTTVLLIEKNPARRAAAVHKVLRSVDTFLNHYSPDGGCNEGPGYWGHAGASFFDCMELMHSATAGRYNLYGNAFIKNIGRYIYRVHIDRDFFFNSADASPRTSPSADLVFRYGKRIEDDAMVSFGAWLAQQETRASGGVSTFRQLNGLFNSQELARASGQAPYIRDVWLPDLQVFAARDRAGSAQGLYVGAKGGHNDESHNHNDVGSFIIYQDGLPVLVDPGVGAYTLQTFGPQRYDIWTMQSAYHNLPTINGIMQKDGRQFAASDLSNRVSENTAEVSMELAGAYPSEANVRSWKRTVRMNRGANVEIIDSFDLVSRVSEVTFSLMTPCQVEVVSPGRLQLSGNGTTTGTATILYDPKLTVDLEQVSLIEGSTSASTTTSNPPNAVSETKNRGRLAEGWRSDHLTRILLRATTPPVSGALTMTISAGTRVVSASTQTPSGGLIGAQ